jgi:hypothetical protein
LRKLEEDTLMKIKTNLRAGSGGTNDSTSTSTSTSNSSQNQNGKYVAPPPVATRCAGY